MLALGSGALAFVVGFIAFTPATMELMIRQGGYYYVAAVFVGFSFYALRLARSRAELWQQWLRAPGWPGLALIGAAVFVLWSDPFKHKVLFDEYVLQGTAFQMHAAKEYGTLVRAYEIAGSWVAIDSFADKRPYFFTFLVSLVHDLTGYRLINIFLVNVALTPVFLALVYWLDAHRDGPRAGVVRRGVDGDAAAFGPERHGGGHGVAQPDDDRTRGGAGGALPAGAG